MGNTPTLVSMNNGSLPMKTADAAKAPLVKNEFDTLNEVLMRVSPNGNRKAGYFSLKTEVPYTYLTTSGSLDTRDGLTISLFEGEMPETEGKVTGYLKEYIKTQKVSTGVIIKISGKRLVKDDSVLDFNNYALKVKEVKKYPQRLEIVLRPVPELVKKRNFPTSKAKPVGSPSEPSPTRELKLGEKLSVEDFRELIRWVNKTAHDLNAELKLEDNRLKASITIDD